MGQLASRHDLSRSTLLYYDRIGLLSPSSRSPAGYRHYSTADDQRLARICRYRRAGLSLDMIRQVLDFPDTDLSEVLATRLEALNQEIRQLREQQRFILVYLRDGQSLTSAPFLTADRFVELLELVGLSQTQQTQWHAAFERVAADEHQAFLEFLCLHDDAIRRIRQSATRGVDHTGPPRRPAGAPERSPLPGGPV